MDKKNFAVAILHYPTNTHELNFYEAVNEVDALKEAIKDFVDSETMVTDEQMEYFKTFQGNINTFIDELSFEDLFCVVAPVPVTVNT